MYSSYSDPTINVKICNSDVTLKIRGSDIVYGNVSDDEINTQIQAEIKRQADDAERQYEAMKKVEETKKAQQTE